MSTTFKPDFGNTLPEYIILCSSELRNKEFIRLRREFLDVYGETYLEDNPGEAERFNEGWNNACKAKYPKDGNYKVNLVTQEATPIVEVTENNPE